MESFSFGSDIFSDILGVFCLSEKVMVIGDEAIKVATNQDSNGLHLECIVVSSSGG